MAVTGEISRDGSTDRTAAEHNIAHGA
jgi:hypothetical protein